MGVGICTRTNTGPTLSPAPVRNTIIFENEIPADKRRGAVDEARKKKLQDRWKQNTGDFFRRTRKNVSTWPVKEQYFRWIYITEEKGIRLSNSQLHSLGSFVWSFSHRLRVGILYTGYKVKSTRKNNFSSSTHLVSIPLLLPSPYSLYLLILEKKEGTKYIYIYSRLFSKEASTRRSNVKLLVVCMYVCIYRLPNYGPLRGSIIPDCSPWENNLYTGYIPLYFSIMSFIKLIRWKKFFVDIIHEYRRTFNVDSFGKYTTSGGLV